MANTQSNEPACNIGKSLSVMKQLFPKLRYVKSDAKSDEYEDGYLEDVTAIFFYLKDRKVVEEYMIIQSNDGFARSWYNSMVDAMLKYPYGFGASGYNAKYWGYSFFTLHLIYVSENGTNTAMIIYENGGYNTGVTRVEFLKNTMATSVNHLLSTFYTLSGRKLAIWIQSRYRKKSI